MEFQAKNLTPISKDDIKEAAKIIGCEPAAVRAVSIVEDAGRSGFLPEPDNRAVILVESHAFHTQTKGIYDNSHPNISTSSWVHNYGASGAHQYDRLYEAIALNREAALKSASWGAFQIMGSNWELAGYDSIEDFVTWMCTSNEDQLNAFVAFIQNSGLDVHLKNKTWTLFTEGYNGLGQIEFYTNRITQAYAQAVAQGYNT